MELSGPSLGVVGMIAVLVLLLIRIPIGVTLAMVSVGGLYFMFGSGVAISLLRDLPYEFAASWSLSSIPMFLLMGFICYSAGLTDGLFRAASLWLRWLSGGLAIGSVLGAALFSAVSGSSLACAAAMSKTTLPEMLSRRYDASLAAGTVAAAGTLGTLLPPSITLIVYGIFVQVSIRDLFMAGVLPGLIVAAGYGLMIFVRTWLKPELAPRIEERPEPREKWDALIEVWPVLVLSAGVLGGLMAGFFSPSESGAIGAFLSIVIALVRRSLTLGIIRDAVVETITVTSAIFLIIIGADLFTKFLVLTELPNVLSGALVDMGLSQLQLILMMCAIFFLLGMFVEPIGIMLLTLPILLPTIEASGINLIWLGILVVKFTEIGLITPPVGLNVFVVKAVAGNLVTLTQIFRGIGWFLAVDAVVIAILIAFPEVVLFLPNLAR